MNQHHPACMYERPPALPTPYFLFKAHNSLPMLGLHSIRTFVMCMTTWSLSKWRLKRPSLEGLKTHTSTSCSWSDFAVNSQLRFTLLDHRAQRALLDHYTHNLIKGIGSSHSGVLGVGVVCRLVVPISNLNSAQCPLTHIYSQQPQQHQLQQGSSRPDPEESFAAHESTSRPSQGYR